MKNLQAVMKLTASTSASTREKKGIRRKPRRTELPANRDENQIMEKGCGDIPRSQGLLA